MTNCNVRLADLHSFTEYIFYLFTFGAITVAGPMVGSNGGSVHLEGIQADTGTRFKTFAPKTFCKM